MKNNRNKLDYIIIFLIYALLFCISNCLKIGFVTHPIFLAMFFLVVFIYLFFRKRIVIDDIKKISFKSLMSYGFISFSLVTFVSIVLNQKYSLTNIFEIVRQMVYGISLITLIALFKNKNNIKLFNKMFIIMIFLMLIINVIQYYNLGNINDLYIRVIAPTQYRTLVNNYSWPRIVGLTSNPNVYGYIITLFNLYIIYLFFKAKEKKTRILLVLVFLVNKFSLFLTGSRTSYITMICSEFLFAGLNLLSVKGISISKKMGKIFSVGAILLVIEAAFIFILPEKYNWRIKELFLQTVRTWEMRKESTNMIVEEFFNENESENTEVGSDDNNKNTDNKYYTEEDKERIKHLINENESNSSSKLKRILFGLGPIKENIIFENEWVQIFTFYGIFGVISFISIFLLPFVKRKMVSRGFITFYISICISNFVYMIAAGTFFSYNSFISVILFISLVYGNEMALMENTKINKIRKEGIDERKIS